MRFAPSPTMSVSEDDISPPDGQLDPHPHLTALIKWWMSCVWSVAGLVLRRLLRVPPALPALPALGRVRRLLAPSPGAPPSPADPEPSVTCSVLCDPPNANVDVIFVHGLYGSLPNTWKQGQWRSKHKTGPKRIPLKRHVSLPENNHINDANNNAKIHKEPRVRKRNKSEEYCSCDDRYYTINVKKQSDISDNNKNNIQNNCKPIEEYTLKKFSRKEMSKRRQTIPNVIGKKIPRTEIIETIHIEQFLREIIKNPTAFNIKIDEPMRKDDNLFVFLEKLLGSNNNGCGPMTNVYQHYKSMKDIHRNKRNRKSILNIDFTSTNEEYKSLGDDLNQICDRIEYFISRLNSPSASEVGYENLCDDFSRGINNNVVFNSRLNNYNDILNTKSIYRLGGVAINVDESALNNNFNSKSGWFDCDKVVCDSFNGVDHENVLVFQDSPNVLYNHFDGDQEENNTRVTSEPNNINPLDCVGDSMRTLNYACREKSTGTKVRTTDPNDMFDDKRSRNLDFFESFNKEINSFCLEDLEEKILNEKELQNKGNNSDLKEIKEKKESDVSDRDDAEEYQNKHSGEADDERHDENECGEVSDDSCGGKSCEVGCGCVCSRCYSTCWPRDWLQVDCPRARVIAVNYTSDPYLWRPIWIKEQKRTGLQQRADEMVQQLLHLGVGRKPIVWVGHSKGGLFIKQIYTDAYESYCASQRDTGESSGNTTKCTNDESENGNDKCFDRKTSDNVVEELTNDNFSVRLETEFNDGSELNFGLENFNDMVSGGKEDFCFDVDNNIESDLEDNCMDFDRNGSDLNRNKMNFEEYMFTSMNIEEVESIRDGNRSFDFNGDQFPENELLLGENHRISEDNEGYADENQKIEIDRRFSEENESFERRFDDDRYCLADERNNKFDSAACKGLNVRIDTEETDKSCLWSNTKGFMFYSVPHRGSPLAGIRSPLFARSVELLEISENCASVLALQGAWLRAVRAASPRAAAAPHSLRPSVLVRSFVETARTLMAVLWLRIVSVESADAGVGELCGVGLDHREICKPSSRSCFLYRELLALIRRDDTIDTS